MGQYHEAEEPDAVDSVYREGDKLYIESERTARAELRAEGGDPLRRAGIVVRVSAGCQWEGDRRKDDVRAERLEGAGAVQRCGVRLNHALDYSRSVVMMPMRDGVKLHAVILRPAGSETSGEPLPFLMQRTPYGTDG